MLSSDARSAKLAVATELSSASRCQRIVGVGVMVRVDEAILTP